MRIALLGVSHWHAVFHARGFSEAGGQLVAGSDPHQLAVDAFVQDWGGKGYTDYRQMIEQENPDFAVVMGTPLEMPGYARFLIERGIPFATEKPLTLTADQLWPLVVEARSRELFVSVALANRYSGIFTALEHHPSPVLHAHFKLVAGYPERYLIDKVPWVLDPQIGGGGPLRNLGIHAIDAILALGGGEPFKLQSAVLSRRRHGLEIEDYAVLTLLSAGGVVGVVETGYTLPTLAPGGDYRFVVATHDRYLQEDAQGLRSLRMGQAAPEELDTPPSSRRYQVFAADTLSRLAAGQPPRVSLEDLWAAMALIDQAYREGVWA